MKTDFISMRASLALFLTLFASVSSNAQVLEWNYKDWSAKKTNDQYYKFVTHGTVAYGNEFGFLVSAEKCESENFWLTIGTDNKGLDTYKGQYVGFDVEVDGVKYGLTAPLLNTFSVGSMEVGLFTNISLDTSFRKALSDGKNVTFSIPETDPAFSYFDIPYETFSLSGITASHLKAKSACLNGDSEFDKKKNELKQEKHDFERMEKEYYSSESSFFDDNSFQLVNEECSKAEIVSKLLQNTDPYAVNENIMFTGKGNDRETDYPRITVHNLCAPDDSSLITDIPFTDAQIFSMEVIDEKLYVMSNYNNRPYIKPLNDVDMWLATLQEFDIGDLRNIKLNREIILNGLVPSFFVYGDKVFIENDDEVLTLDTALPKHFIVNGSKSLTFDKYSSSDIAVTKDNIFVTGNNQLIVIDRNNKEKVYDLTFEYRTGHIFVIEDYLLVFGWKNGTSESFLTTLKKENGKLVIIDQKSTDSRIGKPSQHGRSILDRLGKRIITLNENGVISINTTLCNQLEQEYAQNYYLLLVGNHYHNHGDSSSAKEAGKQLKMGANLQMMQSMIEIVDNGCDESTERDAMQKGKQAFQNFLSKSAN
ncbi:hypothetical protein [Vibrio sp. 705]|uniref:hypothetical protein n=2 Tax=Vibrio TaxID=662 RepID=UPI002965185C|nr:hypothetical protein [Vibrio sp. 705]MDW1906917.1 hypothetical protein [Vibrio sp. 705]